MVNNLQFFLVVFVLLLGKMSSLVNLIPLNAMRIYFPKPLLRQTVSARAYRRSALQQMHIKQNATKHGVRVFHSGRAVTVWLSDVSSLSSSSCNGIVLYLYEWHIGGRFAVCASHNIRTRIHTTVLLSRVCPFENRIREC